MRPISSSDSWYKPEKYLGCWRKACDFKRADRGVVLDKGTLSLINGHQKSRLVVLFSENCVKDLGGDGTIVLDDCSHHTVSVPKSDTVWVDI